jgi:hypothetical protein
VAQNFLETRENLLVRTPGQELRFAYLQEAIATSRIGKVFANAGASNTNPNSRRFVMKNFLLRLALAFSVMSAALALTVTSDAQEGKSGQQPPIAAQQQAPQQNEMQTQEAKPFNGTIMKEKGKLVLKDTAANISYQLDDQEKAKQFVGKQVKVTGKLDMNNNLIHVETIEAAS